MSYIILFDRVKLVMSGGGVKAAFDLRGEGFDTGAEMHSLLAAQGVALNDIIDCIKKEDVA